MKFKNVLNESMHEYRFISWSTKMDSFSAAGTDPSDAARKVAEMMAKTRKYGKYKPLSIVKDGVDAFLEYFSFDFVEEDGVEIWCRSTGWEK